MMVLPKSSKFHWQKASGQFHFSIHPFPVSVCYFVLTTHSKTCCCCSTNSTRTEIRNSIDMKPVGNFWSPNWIWTLGWTPSWWWSCQKVHLFSGDWKNLFLRLKKFDIQKNKWPVCKKNCTLGETKNQFTPWQNLKCKGSPTSTVSPSLISTSPIF